MYSSSHSRWQMVSLLKCHSVWVSFWHNLQPKHSVMYIHSAHESARVCVFGKAWWDGSCKMRQFGSGAVLVHCQVADSLREFWAAASDELPTEWCTTRFCLDQELLITNLKKKQVCYIHLWNISASLKQDFKCMAFYRNLKGSYDCVVISISLL